MTEFWLIRHGQTDWNKEGRYQGQADIPMNAVGLQQAEDMAKRLAETGLKFAAVYTSDLIRARQTAEAITCKLGLPLNVEPGLREISQGLWEGDPYREVLDRYQQLALNGGLELAQIRAPQGESVSDVAFRLTAAVNRIAACHPAERVVLVSHGLALASLLCTARDIPLNNVYNHLPKSAVPEVLHWGA